jgi:hypothetical protein
MPALLLAVALAAAPDEAIEPERSPVHVGLGLQGLGLATARTPNGMFTPAVSLELGVPLEPGWAAYVHTLAGTVGLHQNVGLISVVLQRSYGAFSLGAGAGYGGLSGAGDSWAGVMVPVRVGLNLDPVGATVRFGLEGAFGVSPGDGSSAGWLGFSVGAALD